ncbi:MAG: DUF1501 domain-containing protein [Planctomycetes bacterium]|nr:DUF1501 domain-containing protein [Planctomycetota bacterium]
MISRRGFLQNSVGALALGGTLPTIMEKAVAAQAAGGGSKNGRILVVVTLAGGNDGLNTVVPFEQDPYYKLRPTIGHPKADVRKISDQIGLHPLMKKTEAAFKDGHVAVMLGVGYPNPNRSHFHSMDVWQSADPELNNTRTGWLGRVVDSAPDARENAMFAFHLGEETPRMLLAENRRITTFSSLQDYNLVADRFAPNDRTRVERAWDAMARDGAAEAGGSTSLQLARRTMAQALVSANELKDVLGKSATNATYPQGGLAQNFKLAGQVIGAGLPVHVVSLTFGGFDTHANEKNSHAQLWQQIDDAVAAFIDDLAQRGRADDVAIMLYSEFGRRVAENGSAGTDHGAAAPVFIYGKSVGGGIYGEQPSLANLDDGDVKFSTDFRRIYSTILENWLSVDSQPILGAKFDKMPFMTKNS